ncbi:hypothetical protein FG386_000058 [Cryptosporidium ryanae]|uniref:uncharacterized protein n=1 Tax=Cryptosporidium ryanae TaxID=515981 RepID=UPI00351A37DB|nr:hypothetical protein FG386_000058 [Cryptosporidium ryanae]
MIKLGEHKSGPWITHERVGNLTSVYAAFFNSTNKENCKGSNTCNPIALRYYDRKGKEFLTFLNTELTVQRLLKRKVAIRERLWVGDDPSVLCAGIDKNGHITGIGFGYKQMMEPTPLLIDAVKMVKSDIIAYPLSLNRNQTINTAISYNPEEMQVSFLSNKITGCNNSYSPNKNNSSKSTVQIHAQCKYDFQGAPQYIGKIILFLDNTTNELKRIGGICTNGNKHSHNSHLGSQKASNSISGSGYSAELIQRNLKAEDGTKIISTFDHDKWPVNKWAPSPLRVQHSSLYRNKEYENSEVFQNSVDLSFAFGQSISPSISVVSSESGPFNSIYLGYNSESTNPIMLTTRLNQLDSSKKTLLMQYSSFFAPSTITYWETPTVDDHATYTDSICVELEQKNGNIVGIGFEGSMSSVPYESLDDSVKVVKAVIDDYGRKSLEVTNMQVATESEGASHIENSKNNTKNSNTEPKVGNKILVENRINEERCPKLALNKALMEHLDEISKTSGAESLSNSTKDSLNNKESDIGVPFTITCPECTEIEFIKAHYIIDGPIIGLEWKCTGLNNVDTLFLGGRSPSQVTTQIFNKVQPKMIEVAFYESFNTENRKSKDKLNFTKGMPGPGFLSIDGYIGSGKIQQLLYYRMKDINFGPTVTWESNEKLKAEKHVLRTVCGRLSSSQAILGLGFGFEYLPLECSSREIKPNFIPVDNKHSNKPTVVINGGRMSQKVDMLHPNCSPIQGGSAKTRLSNWVISFSCLNNEMNEEVPFSGLSALRSVSKNMNGMIKVLTLFCPDQKTSVSIGENDSDVSKLVSQYFDISKPGYSLSIDFSPLTVVPTQIKMNPPYSSPSIGSTTISSVSGFNRISTSSDSIYGVCFELTSDGKIAGIAFANKPSPHNISKKKSKL